MGSVLRRSPSAGACRRPCMTAHRAAATSTLLTSRTIAQVPERALQRQVLPSGLAVAGVLLTTLRSCLGLDGGAEDVVAGGQHVL